MHNLIVPRIGASAGLVAIVLSRNNDHDSPVRTDLDPVDLDPNRNGCTKGTGHVALLKL